MTLENPAAYQTNLQPEKYQALQKQKPFVTPGGIKVSLIAKKPVPAKKAEEHKRDVSRKREAYLIDASRSSSKVPSRVQSNLDIHEQTSPVGLVSALDEV